METTLHVAAQAVVNVYREPDAEAEVTSQVLHGWPVEVLERRGEWAHVCMHDAYTGWLRLEGLAEVSAPGGLRVESNCANIYAEPDVKRRAALLQVPWEARLWEIADEGVWLRVRLADGREGFVHAGDVARNWPALDVAGMLAVGRRFLGVTYTWGGVSSFGYDCSGLVQMLFRQLGVTIPRDAQAQARWHGFESIRVEQAEAGDVLFFGATDDEITHVALCVGAGDFLHDTTEGRPGVQVSRLSDEPWATRVRAARRLRG